jgi:hypothetical protein
MYDDTTDKFWKLYGDDLCEQLSEQSCDPDNKMYDHIGVINYDRINMLNIRMFVEVTLEGQEPFCVEYESGNNNGFAIHKFGPNIQFEEYEPDVRYFAPTHIDTYVRNLTYIREQERKMNYDFHFDPSSRIFKYYNDWASNNACAISTREPYKILKYEHAQKMVLTVMDHKDDGVKLSKFTQAYRLFHQIAEAATWTLYWQHCPTEIERYDEYIPSAGHLSPPRYRIEYRFGDNKGTAVYLRGNVADFEDYAMRAILMSK